MSKWVYSFGGDKTEGAADLKNLLGGKGANLAEMASLGLPVPAGFTITTEVCTAYYKNDESYPDDLEKSVADGITHIEKAIGKKFGDANDPLLLSVRSGARVSMPGMMDTVLNLGLNDETVKGLAAKAGDERFAWDSYRRFIQMYGDVVMGVPHYEFEDILEQHKRDEDITQDTDVTAEGWKDIVTQYKEAIKTALGKPFPDDPQEQLWGAVGAVFKSWNTSRAVAYRHIHDIPHEWGTAVNVQAMVFGNMGEDCATGVAFTRDPSTGEKIFYGEYLINAQGEDVVAGIRTPQSLTIAGKEKEGSDLPAMEETMGEVFGQLDKVRETLENHYRDMQDIEFTIQQGTLYMLQTRTGKRTTAAALKIAVDMVDEGLIDKDEALLRIDPLSLDQLLHPTLDPGAHKKVLTKGLPASPGAASGEIVFSADKAEELAAKGRKVILVRRETSPEDIHGMHAATGILTSRGGMTSHAAVVARGMGRPCVAGAGAVHIDYDNASLSINDTDVSEGELLTIDGATGEVILGSVPTIQPELSEDFATLMGWADTARRMEVRTNAETPADAEMARSFGAQGIGLCRTEHMFFDPDRIQAVREMIFAVAFQDRKAALDKLLPAQRQDFVELFIIMGGLPVTIRLLDPPLHEFLPHSEKEIEGFSKAADIPVDRVKRRLDDLHESNPMLGHRGCRLGISHPEIYEMQIQAILEAAIQAKKETSEEVTPEIMIPLTGSAKEFEILKKVADEVAEKVFEAAGDKTPYIVGTMIELPRAALVADKIAEAGAEFFSFGTNDLTQTTLGLSRDDAGNFLGDYIREGIYERDPFTSIDTEGVGQLVDVAAQKGRSVKADMKLGICGEHGGDPLSIEFCEGVGLDYVSCSPFRVPIARLAAAQSYLKMNVSAVKKKKAA